MLWHDSFGHVGGQLCCFEDVASASLMRGGRVGSGCAFAAGQSFMGFATVHESLLT